MPAGTVLPVQLEEAVSLDPKNAGKSYAAHIARAVTLNGGTVIPAGTAARVTTRKPATKNAKQAPAVLAELTLNGKVLAVPSRAARVEASPQAASAGKSAGALGVKVGGSQGAGGRTYVNVSPSVRQLDAGATLGFALERPLALQ